MSSSDLDKQAIEYCKQNKSAYLAEIDGHKIMVVRTPQGKGYAPYQLLNQNKHAEAANVAAKAFSQGL